MPLAGCSHHKLLVERGDLRIRCEDGVLGACLWHWQDAQGPVLDAQAQVTIGLWFLTTISAPCRMPVCSGPGSDLLWYSMPYRKRCW